MVSVISADDLVIQGGIDLICMEYSVYLHAKG